MKKLLCKYWGVICITVFFVVCGGYVCFYGDNIPVQIHDNLDSNIANYQMLSENNLWWSSGQKLPILHGLERNLVGDNLKVDSFLYMIFPTFQAMVIDWFLKVGISIAGFCFLGSIIFVKEETKFNLLALCGLVYGITPTFPTSASAFSSLPLFLGLLIMIYRSPKNYKLYLLVLLYPVFSYFSTFGIFICGFLVIFFLIDWIVRKRPAWGMLVSAGLVFLGYMGTEWRLFYEMLFTAQHSIRNEFVSAYLSFGEMLKDIWNVFVNGHYHSGDLHKYIVLPVCIFYFIYLNVNYLIKKNAKGMLKDYYNWICIWIVFNCVVYGLDEFEPFRQLISNLIPQLAGLSFARTLWFNPFLWYFAFTIVLFRLKKQWIRYGLCFTAFCTICLMPEIYNAVHDNLLYVAYELTGREYGQLTYHEFYSEDLFEDIKEDIDYGGEWSVAYGIHPAVLAYNGISCIDGYNSTYPVEYKHEFRKLIEPELALDEANAAYFDNWGGRAYIFSNEISYEPVREMEQTEAHMYINLDVFRAMDGTYVFSRVGIINAMELGLNRVGVYQNEESPYVIYVYRMRESE